ncbi:CBS domain-containing protein [Desulfogranum mediterraneum]|uniref:CBS domain-containing protein n=1 Tax=Desulfogranum mediterraneum TaxID=160661 RepID=UPI000491BBC1|nr:CBS domain-containing protein [Desulfogranum mediterraneum]
MFAVYEVTGRSLHDSLEALYRVKRLHPAIAAHQRRRDEPAADLGAAGKSRVLLRNYQQHLPPHLEHPVVQGGQLMHAPVITVPESFSPEACWELLCHNRISQVPVVDHQGQLVGITTRGDLLKVLVVNGESVLKAADLKAADHPLGMIMSPQVVTVEPAVALQHIARVLCDCRFNSLPVVDRHAQLLGIVTRTDIVRAVATQLEVSLWA